MNHIYCGHTLAWRRRPSRPGPGAAEQRGRVPPPPPGGHGDAGGCAGNRDSNATLLPAVREQGGPCLFPAGPEGGPHLVEGEGEGAEGVPAEKPGVRDERPFSSLFAARQLPSSASLLKGRSSARSSGPEQGAWGAQPGSVQRGPSARAKKLRTHGALRKRASPHVRACASTCEHTQAHAHTRHARPTLHPVRLGGEAMPEAGGPAGPSDTVLGRWEGRHPTTSEFSIREGCSGGNAPAPPASEPSAPRASGARLRRPVPRREEGTGPQHPSAGPERACPAVMDFLIGL